MIRTVQTTRAFETDDGQIEIALSDLLWVEDKQDNGSHSSCLHLDDRSFLCKCSFEVLLPSLGDDFLLCLPNGAVNLLRIRRFEADTVVLDNGEKLAAIPFLLQRFHEKYCRELARRVWEDEA